MLTIDSLRINSVQVPHPYGKIALHGFDEQMVMIGHLAPCMADPIEAPACLSKHVKPQQPITVVKIDVFAPVTTGSDVIQTACKLDA